MTVGAIGRLLSVISLPFAFGLHERGPSLPRPSELAIEHVTLIDVAEGGARGKQAMKCASGSVRRKEGRGICVLRQQV